MNTISSRCRLLFPKPTRNRIFTTSRVSTPLRSPSKTAIDWKTHLTSFPTTTTRSFHSTAADHDKKIYLHVGPSGDSWIGDAIFAAKHNQPGYVKSVDLDTISCTDTAMGVDDDNGSLLIDVLEDHPKWAQEIYDTECIPQSLQQHLKSLYYDEDSK